VSLCIDALSVRSVSILGPFIRSGLRLDEGQVGYVMAALLAGTLVITLPVGSLLGRLDTRWVFPLLMTAVGLANLWVASQGTFVGLLGALFVLGLLRAGIIPLVNLVITDHFSQDQRGRILGLVYAAVPLGGFLGAVGMPALAEAFDWHASYRGLGFLALLSGILVWRWTPRSSADRAVIQPRPGLSIPHAFPFIILSFLYMLYALSMTGEVFVALYLVDVAQVPAVLAGTLFGLIQLTGMGGRLFWGFLADRAFSANRWILLAFTTGLTVLGYGLLLGLSPASPLGLVIGIMVILGLSVASSWVILSTLVGDVVGAASVAFASAVIFFLTNITDVTGSVLYGALLDRTHSYQATLGLFLGLAALSTLGFTAMAWWWSKRSRGAKALSGKRV
jgi:predicted MFS family arabinose efflux permease